MRKTKQKNTLSETSAPGAALIGPGSVHFAGRSGSKDQKQWCYGDNATVTKYPSDLLGQENDSSDVKVPPTRVGW